MIKNVDLIAGTFELNGQVLKIPEGIDILKYINCEVEVVEAVEVYKDTQDDLVAKEVREHRFTP